MRSNTRAVDCNVISSDPHFRKRRIRHLSNVVRRSGRVCLAWLTVCCSIWVCRIASSEDRSADKTPPAPSLRRGGNTSSADENASGRESTTTPTAATRVGASPVETITKRILEDLKTPGAGSDNKKGPKDDLTAGDLLAAGDDPASKRSKPGAKSKPKAKNRLPALEAEAQQCKVAEEALLVYKIFMSDPETTDEEKEKAKPRLEYWEQAAKDDLVRSGKNWIPRAEADKLKEEADNLVAEAIALLDLKSYRKADEKLEKASRICPDHLESLFLLGVGALLTNDIKGAEKRFVQCLSRAPNHVPLLNNTAICAALGKKYDRAVKLWEKAAAAEPDNADVAQNVGQFIADATKAKSMSKAEKAQNAALIAKAKAQGKVMIDFSNVDRHVLDDATDLYAKIMAGGKVPRATPTGGYVILKLFQAKKGGSSASPEESQVVGNGSGFVIGEGYVLTNRHVVENADGLLLQDPSNASATLAGTVLAVSKTLDLAIIACPGLKAPPVPVNPVEVSRGTEVLALGFPVMNVVGKGLKATRGIVTGLPSKDTGNMMVLDVQINPGNSGGPLCDKSGRVIGIVAAKTFTERFIQGYGLAIPMSDALGFVTQSIPKFSAKAANDDKLEWTEVDGQISKSTVLILIKKKKKS